MKILMYLEPQFEFDEPNHKQNFLSEWIPPLLESLREAFGRALHVKVLTSDHIANGAVFADDFEVIGYTQDELYNLNNEDPLDMRVEWFSDTPSLEKSLLYGERLKKRLGRFYPDCIISFASGSFFRHVFPDAVLLHHEFGLMSRAPLPQTWYFDPIGPGGTRSIDHFWPQVRDSWTAHPRLGLAQEVMAAYRASISDTNIWEDKIRQLSQGYSYKALLPLQETGHALFNGFSPIRSALQYALSVLSATPENVLTFITGHPGRKGLSFSAREYIMWRYKNAVFLEESEGHYAPSQYFMPHVEAVYSLSTTVGALSTFWGNNLISLSPKYLSCLSDGTTIDTSQNRSTRTDVERAGFMMFLMQTCLVTKQHITDSEWLKTLLTNAINGHHNLSLRAKAIFPAWKTEEAVAQLWLETIEENTRAPRQEAAAAAFISAARSGDWSGCEKTFDHILMQSEALSENDIYPELLYYMAMFNLNARNHPLKAADLFKRAYEACCDRLSVRADERIRGFYWWSGFHAAYALKGAGEPHRATIMAHELLNNPNLRALPILPDAAVRLSREILN